MPDALGEGLAFGFVLLAMTLDTVAEDLVEEDAGGASGEDSGADEGLGFRRLKKIGYVIGHAIHCGFEHLVVGQPGSIDGFEGFKRAEVGSIGGFGGRGNHHAREAAAVLDARAFRIDEVTGYQSGR